MPTYTYRCRECGHQFDQRQKFSDDPLTECPNCQGNIRRVVNNSSAIVFKGSGFYVTDNKSGKKTKAAASGESKSSSNSDGEKSDKKEKSSESKSEPAKAASSSSE